MQTKTQDMGFRGELQCFANGISLGDWPIPLWQKLQVSQMAFEIEEMTSNSKDVLRTKCKENFEHG
jgi:hypothetical protein